MEAIENNEIIMQSHSISISCNYGEKLSKKWSTISYGRNKFVSYSPVEMNMTVITIIKIV